MPPPIPLGADGYYHPNLESEVVDLVKFARANGRKIRVRGAGIR